MNYPFKDYHLYETEYLNPSLGIETFQKIYTYLDRHHPQSAAELYGIDWQNPGEWGVWKIEDKDADFKGTWGKRFSNMVYRRRGVKIPGEILNYVSNIVQNTLRVHDANKLYCYQFVQHADWEPGAFAESSTSCWWDDYNNARISIIKEGGRAMLIYPSKEDALRFPLQGIGRCWVFPTTDSKGFVLFNGYGVNLQTIAHVVGTQLGWFHRNVDIQDVEGAYINGETGYLLTPTPSTVNWVELDEFVKWKKCHGCGDTIPIYKHVRCSCYTKREENMRKLSASY